MKDIYKEPVFYYIVVPLVVAVWPLWLFGFGLQTAKDDYAKDQKRYEQAEKYISQILGDLDPERLDYAMAKKTNEAFDYTVAVDQVTKFCGILPSNYKLSSSATRKMRGGQKSQDANVNISQIDLERFAKFMSVMHMRWGNLQCTNVTLTKIKGEKNLWKTDLRFIYYQ